MSGFLQVTVLLVALSLVVTSQPFRQPDPSKHTDFMWNSRKIGNKKVATITIRKDEERDRRSIPLVDRDDPGTAHSHSQRRHSHRHQHGEGTRAAMWLTDERSPVERPNNENTGVETSHRSLSPLYVAESGVEESTRVRSNDVHPESDRGEDHMPSFPEILEEAGVHLKPSLLENRETSPRRGKSTGGRKGRGKKNKRQKSSKRNRNNKVKNKKRKSCRRLKGERRRSCQRALRQCRSLRKRKKKKCRADALRVAFSEDMFSFLKNITEMSGTEACHYHYLKKCYSQVDHFTESPDRKMPVVKCHFRKKFLKCMETQRRGTCDPTFHTRGDLSALRKKIKEFIWTPSSCLISDVVEGQADNE